MPNTYKESDEQAYDHEIEFFIKDTVKWDSQPQYAAMIAALAQMKSDHPALYTSNPGIEILDADNPDMLAFKRSLGGDTVIFIANTRYEAVKGVTVKADFDKLTCVMRYDGKKLSMDEAEMTAADFESQDFPAYAFYVMIVK